MSTVVPSTFFTCNARQANTHLNECPTIRGVRQYRTYEFGASQMVISLRQLLLT
jgi:hypothetical protein